MSREYSLKKEVKNKDHRLLLLCLLSFFVFSLVSLYSGPEVYAGQATLSWVAPSTNEDGTPLTDLAGYKIYYGTASGSYTQNVDVGNVTTYAFNSLNDGQTYYFVATAYNLARFESSYSNEISKIIPSSTQNFTLSVNKAGTGIVTSSPAGINCGSDCTESYTPGTSITLTVSPDTSSTFIGWSGACIGTGTCSVTMNAAKSVTATFALKTYAIIASASTGGSISPIGSVSVNHGASQSFNITANSGYSIANVLVDGASVGAVASYTFSNVTANHTISASFTAVQQNSLNVTKAGTGTGIVTSSPAGITCGSDCTESYTAGTVVTLTATPDSGSTFTGWSGACTGSGTCSVTMNGAKNVTATFTLKTYTITVTASSGGSISPSGTVTVNNGGSQSFTITPDANYTIGNVLVNGVSAGSVTTYNFANVTANHTISANFTAVQQNSLNIAKAGTGSGTVTSSPSGINCGSDCSETYNSGTSITLTASPDASSTFTGWSGACTGSGTCSVTMNGAKNLTATFNLKTYTITVTASSGGSISPSGTVTVNNGGSQSFTITPDTNYTIANVLVDGVSAGSVTTYNFANVTANHTISASFTAVQQNSLNVTKAGTGTGIVTSSPTGITCGSDCTESYTPVAVVTLTATPDSSSTFTGWSGACTGSGTCSVTMNGAKNVTATFNLKTYTITATASSGGSISPSGTVTVNNGGSQSFTITPDTNYTIGNVLVDGVSAGSVSTYNFANITAYHTISASFTAVQQNSLNVTKAGTGTGIVTSSPAGINCGSDCTKSYTAGTVVTLTATPDSSSTFAGWSGACTGSGTCLVTMNGSKSVTATFTLKTYTITSSAGNGGSISPSVTVTVNNGGNQSFTITPDANYTIANVLVDGVSAGSVTTYNFANVTANHTISASFTAVQQNSLNIAKAGTGSGVVTSSPSGINCGSDCSEVYTAGTVVTLSATPDSSSSFGGWSGACTGSGTCTVTMDTAKSVSPLFQANGLTITASTGNGGSISPSGTVTVNYAGSQSFTITPDADYTIGDVLVDGISAGAVTSYSFTNVTGNHTISVNFTQNNGGNTSATNIPKTGQTLIYASGDDGNIQAGVAWPAQRFTDNGDGTVTDSLTGLMWLKDGGCMKAKWKSALTAVAGLNNHQGQNNCAGYTGNYSDWRLPTVNELKSLVTYGTPDSAQWLNSEGFVNMKSTYYWSATSYLGTATRAWMITLNNGVEKIGSSNTGYILPVRIVASDSLPKAGQAVIYNPSDEAYIQEKIAWPAPRFTDNGDGTVTDSLTGLMWLKDGGCMKKRWSDALNIIGDFNVNPLRYSCLGYTANYSDWRMPNVKELESMINYETSDAVGWLNSAGFTNVKYSSYWSSTTSQMSAARAWMMNMKKSGKLLQNKKSNYYAWPVRGGNVDKE